MAHKEFIFPKGYKWDEKTLNSNYGKVVIEPLERGYGVTIGNALRRVLLSSIPGDAVTSVKIDGVLHENSAIPGVAEDTLDILMNIKSMVVQVTTDEPQTLILDVEDEGVVTANNFEPNSMVQILNPDLPIATLSPGGCLRMEVTVGRGLGYVPADENKKPHQPIGSLPIDSIFSPVRRVRYEVENTRVEQYTDYEKVTLEIWTNGSITPQDALLWAANILIDHFKVLIQVMGKEDAEAGVSGGLEAGQVQPVFDKNLDRSIEELELSVRAYNCLKAANIKTIRELITKTEEELLKYRNFGKVSLNEIKEVLGKMEYSLGMTIKDGKPIPPPPEEDEEIEEEEEVPKSTRSKSRSK